MTLFSRTAISSIALAALAACNSDAPEDTPSQTAEEARPAAPSEARFAYLTYTGNDDVFERVSAGEGEYLNPVLAGFYPDPSITEVDGNYYTVNSTFAYFPGIPVMHSTDLVNWRQVGNAIDREGMLDFDGLRLSRGVFAPTIEHHDGTFYIANTCVDCGGNFIITAEDPAGPWSDPVWLPEVGGIDPSLFFDEDGSVWIMNNDAPEGGSTYEGHRAIWIRQIDPETFQSISEPVQIINGGVRLEDKPIWIEGPHIYKVGDYYYLSAAEGGTAINHSQVILRSENVDGPYTPYEDNPILTQRDQPADRPDPITSVGHADYVTDDEGNWWAVFLGVRPYEGDYYNTGRETFMLPVEWNDEGWPIILERGAPLEYVLDRPALPLSSEPDLPLNGNFTVTERFEGDEIPPHFMTLRVPKEEWWSLDGEGIALTPRADALGESGQPSYWGRRQQHLNATAETEVTFTPATMGDEAGLAAVQSDDFFYSVGVGMGEEGGLAVVVRQKAGAEEPARGTVIESAAIEDADAPVGLRIEARGVDGYDLSYRVGSGDWQTLAEGLDPTVLSTRRAGGFVGATFGLYANAAE